jgi:uncharacterized protein
MEQDKTLHELNDVEIRVLGSLMEKSKTTPDYYPMTINALTAACNQKSSRYPVVEYDEETVMAAIRSLKGQNLVSLSVGGTNRTNKFKHNFDIVYNITPAEYAVLCLLFLRGPLTPGEINSSSGRLYEFSSLSSVNETLLKLSEAHPPFVKEMNKRAGQKETRFMHLFGGTIHETEPGNAEEIHVKKPVNELENRVEALEKELAEVKEKLERLMKELMG